MSGFDPDGIRKILIRSPNWIGDAVMTTPAMGVVRSSFPDAEIAVAANFTVAEIFRHHPYCDRIVVYDKKGMHQGFPGLLRFCGELRGDGFDLAVLFQNAFEAAVIALLARIPMRAGYRTDGRRFLLPHGVPAGNAERRLHHTAYYAHMLRALGISGGGDSVRDGSVRDGSVRDGSVHDGSGDDWSLRLECTAEELAWARKTTGGGPVVVINPGAAYGSAKRWLPERFAAVGDILAGKLSARVALIGGPGETEIGRDICAAMQEQPLNLIGRTSVREVMAILGSCRIMVTNDSGPMHIAAALGAPVVAIFGPTDHTTTSPLSPNSRIVRKETECSPCLLRRCPTDHRCMEDVTVSDVVEAALELAE